MYVGDSGRGEYYLSSTCREATTLDFAILEIEAHYHTCLRLRRALYKCSVSTNVLAGLLHSNSSKLA
jgi:hypothetical protein